MRKALVAFFNQKNQKTELYKESFVNSIPLFVITQSKYQYHTLESYNHKLINVRSSHTNSAQFISFIKLVKPVINDFEKSYRNHFHGQKVY